MTTRQLRPLAIAAGAAVALLALAGCSAPSAGGTTGTAAASSSGCTVQGKKVNQVNNLRSQVPASILSTGHLTIATAGDGAALHLQGRR